MGGDFVDTPKSDIALRIEYALMKRNMTATALAERVGRTRGAVSHWLNNRNGPPRSILPQVAENLGVSVSWLMGENVPEESRDLERLYLETATRLGPEVIELLDDFTPEQLTEAIQDFRRKLKKAGSKSATRSRKPAPRKTKLD